MASLEPVVELNGVWKIFGEQALQALGPLFRKEITPIEAIERYDCFVGVIDASFRVQRGEIFCVMGLSGSGKSTILRHINGLIKPTQGEVKVLGKDILKISKRELREVRSKQIGMVFQHMGLLPHITVRENISLPLRLRGESKVHCWETAQRCLELVNLEDHGERIPGDLSGGMKQRVGLARALASDPEVLLMDEPFSALDPLIRRQLQDEFIALSKKLKKTTIFITHDLDEALRLGHRLAIMCAGRIIQIGTPEDILSRPANDYVRSFVDGVHTREVHTKETPP